MLTELHESKVDAAHYEQCRKMMQEIEKDEGLRLIVAGELLIQNAFNNILARYSLLFTLFYSVIIFLLLIFTMPGKPKFSVIIGGLLIWGLIDGWMHIFCALLLGLVLYSGIKDAQKLSWLKEQPGYPGFSAFLAEHELNADKEYQPEHQFDHIHDAEMPEISMVNLSKEKADASKSVVMPDVDDL